MIVNKKFLYLLLPAGMLFTLPACTDLEDVTEDAIGVEVVDGTLPLPPDPAAALRGTYSQLHGLNSQDNAFALMEHPSDEMMGPTRGTDWSDFGVWRQLHSHTWDASHSFVLSGWNQLNSGIFQATQAIAAADRDNNDRVEAEARFLRAYFIYHVADLYGQVPFREATEGFDAVPKVFTRTEAVNRIIEDLTAALPNLPNRASVDAGVATKEAAHALMAKVYLNKAVFTAANPAGPYTFASDDMNKVIQSCDFVINSGVFELTNYWDNFTANNSALSKESIFAIVAETGNGRGNMQSRHRMTLHYNQNPSGWNGFTTIADFYSKWNDGGDVRKGAAIPGVTNVSGLRAGFLEGQQKDQNGNNLTDRGGNPLAFTVDVDLFYASEREGVRVVKYPPDFGNVDSPGNDYHLLRFADVLLMKAEALWRTGNAAGALAIINQIRTHRGAQPVASIAANGQQVLDERGFELYWEGWRRNDQIRFEQFRKDWTFKPASPERVVIFPIPQVALDNNPNLKQNPGY